MPAKKTGKKSVKKRRSKKGGTKRKSFVSQNQWKACFAEKKRKESTGEPVSWDCSNMAHNTKTSFSKLPKRKTHKKKK
jgi:hypothetical protein